MTPCLENEKEGSPVCVCVTDLNGYCFTLLFFFFSGAFFFFLFDLNENSEKVEQPVKEQ